MEQGALYQLGADGQPDTVTPEQKTGAAHREKEVLSFLICPSRRAVKSYSHVCKYVNCDDISKEGCLKTDYAANSGSLGRLAVDKPSSAGDLAKYSDSHSSLWQFQDSDFDGVIYSRSQVSIGEIRDGTSNTFLLGEKYLMPENYETGTDACDNQSAFQGFDTDVHRFTYTIQSGDNRELYQPRQDRSGLYVYRNFGSCHAGSFGMALCDGSVRRVAYDIDWETVYRYLGSRNDGQVATLSP